MLAEWGLGNEVGKTHQSSDPMIYTRGHDFAGKEAKRFEI